jgi:hypothetical protein
MFLIQNLLFDGVFQQRNILNKVYITVFTLKMIFCIHILFLIMLYR